MQRRSIAVAGAGAVRPLGSQAPWRGGVLALPSPLLSGGVVASVEVHDVLTHEVVHDVLALIN